MDRGLKKKPEAFDSFTSVLNVLIIAGYWKNHDPRNICTKIFHEIYRVVVIFFVYVYATQHGIYIWMVRNKDTEKLLEAVIMEIPELSLCYKVVVMYFQTARLDKLTELMKDPMFASRNKKDELYIKNNTLAMTKLVRIAALGLTCMLPFWVAGPFVKRMQDETTTVPSYMPFAVDTWPGFLLSILLETCPILWIGYGHLSIDCLIATYYAQSRLQLKIINYNLKHLFDSKNEDGANGRNFKFLDEMDKTTQERLVHYVNRYERVLWFTKEVTSVFGQAISMQFFLTAFSTCLVVFQMSSTDTFSVAFMFMVGYYVVTQFQIFMYCYYGCLVEYESKFVSDSVYLGEWLSLSPRFRRQLLIAMSRWIKPITPRVSTIIPLSLTTFISISRSAYTLYTVLKTSNNKGSGHRTLAF